VTDNMRMRNPICK